MVGCKLININKKENLLVHRISRISLRSGSWLLVLAGAPATARARPSAPRSPWACSPSTSPWPRPWWVCYPTSTPNWLAFLNPKFCIKDMDNLSGGWSFLGCLSENTKLSMYPRSLSLLHNNPNLKTFQICLGYDTNWNRIIFFTIKVFS